VNETRRSGQTRFLKLAGLAFALGIVALGLGFAGYALSWHWLRLGSFGIGVLAVGIGVCSVAIRSVELIGRVLKRDSSR
jgi:hypothetical protein